ncbi:MAG: PspC domain-containing protein [Nanoarchaeota archaeon]|nr:PspC domain-containing protein [Nanoarchaeota archaeon]
MAKKLYRSRQDRVIAGVCGGIAEHLDVDPVWVRVFTILITIMSVGFGILAYVLFWILVPENPVQKVKKR